MILILAEPHDLHADQIAQLLRQRGADLVRFDHAAFPSQAEISLAYTPTGHARYILRAGAQDIDLSRLRAVWYRFPTIPVPHGHLTERRHRDYVTEECLNFLHDAWHSLDCLWVPGPHFIVQRAQLKATHLQVAGALGFELPPTLFTNSPEDFLEFYRRHNGRVVSKMAGFALARHGYDTFSRYTEVVSKRDVGYAHAVRYCPIIFQAYVPKRVELRITVVGRKVFPVEIRSQETNHTRHDWRRYDHLKTPHHPHDLPPEVGQRCVRLVERLGLCYGAIDMILTPDGRYVFLEINPQGQYQWIERATGLPISDALCDLLLAGAPGPNRPDTYSPPMTEGYYDGQLAASAR
jgi:glutathione synthase/RimK-type ligase-like ATP-grasp enzyme